MSLEWLHRDNELKDHQIFDNARFGKEAPTVIYEERPIMDDKPFMVSCAWRQPAAPSMWQSWTTAPTSA